MNVSFLCDRQKIELSVPDDAVVYESCFPEPAASEAEVVLKALDKPIEMPSFERILRTRRTGDVVVVVSDITRPIPYATFLPQMLTRIESAGVPRDDILILVATGMHRHSRPAEHEEMFGAQVVSNYRISEHTADDEDELVELEEKSWSGSTIKLNRQFMQAGLRIVTGAVEPHFMAGFSGGRKAVWPGLAALEAIQQFHGYDSLSNPKACNGVLDGNPCHEEALSVAGAAGVDFSLNIVFDTERRTVRAFAGGLEAAHLAACDFVAGCACPQVIEEADIALTSSGGYPLDTTFYQCVKGIVSCLPAIRRRGAIIAFGGCREGIGSPEYNEIMVKYAGKWREFLQDIQRPGVFVKDQWELQMHTLALEKVGQDNLHFLTGGLSAEQLDVLSVHGAAVPAEEMQSSIQDLLNELLGTGNKLAVFPDGPYCTPVNY